MLSLKIARNYIFYKNNTQSFKRKKNFKSIFIVFFYFTIFTSYWILFELEQVNKFEAIRIKGIHHLQYFYFYFLSLDVSYNFFMFSTFIQTGFMIFEKFQQLHVYLN